LSRIGSHPAASPGSAPEHLRSDVASRAGKTDDRIDIVSPGGAYGAVTPETFGQPGVVDYRNPNLAEALRVLGFVQRFGFGIATARRELEKNGNPPLTFEVEPNRVLVRVGVRL
jgi:ATP-dependent DNA helicase RecG